MSPAWAKLSRDSLGQLLTQEGLHMDGIALLLALAAFYFVALHGVKL